MAALKLNIRDFLNNRMALTTLAGGGIGTSARWWNVGVALFQLGVPIRTSSLEAIILNYTTPYRQAEGFMSYIGGLIISAELFSRALNLANIMTLADAIEASANGGVQFNASSVSMMIGSINAGSVIIGSVATPTTFAPTILPMAATGGVTNRKRLYDPIEKIEDEDYHLVVKVHFCEEDTPLKNVSSEAVKLVKGRANAKKEANTLMDEDVQTAGGDEDKIKYVYSVWSMQAYAPPQKKQVKDRMKDKNEAK
jgi:hypothetical protein